MSHRIENTAKVSTRGNLRIGDHWNAITIIALSQSNPLKAVAELVENSIDARAKTIVITRGKDKGQHYLRVNARRGRRHARRRRLQGRSADYRDRLACEQDGKRRFHLPGAAWLHVPQGGGGLWRSRFDAERNLVVINNGHRDFVYAARNKMLKLRYICRLFAKELVLKNFVGIPQDQLLERLLELTLYTEDNLR